MGSLVMVLSFLPRGTRAEACHREERNGRTLAQWAGTIVELFPMMSEYVRTGVRSIRLDVTAVFRGAHPAPPKIGRNDSCPAATVANLSGAAGKTDLFLILSATARVAWNSRR
ncbi:MAG: hypothetical protein U0361_00705 [Nitrospiraceae bacterium]